MAKYRALNLEELQSLEKEFVDFLVINGITADEWVKLKAEQPEEATRMTELFSDVVFEGILRKVNFLDYHSQYEVRTFQCLPEKMVLVGLKATPAEGVDFREPDFVNQAIQNPPAGLSIYTTEKAYSGSREAELFEMIQSGCQITEGQLFKALLLAKAASD